MTKQITGSFPVFGKSAKLGNLENTGGKVIVKNNYPMFYSSDKANYEVGFTSEPTYKQLNGILNHITSGLSYLYKQGIPEFTLNVSYPRGAVVTFNGGVFVSKTDNNINHVSQKSFWDKLVTKATEKTNDDGLPIGTILTVPITTEKKGYIDYKEGETFSPTIYPELYTALGTKTFGTAINSNFDSSLPIGSMVHYLSGSSNVPDGWLEWTSMYGSLRPYPELYQVLSHMVQGMEFGTTRTLWEQALRTHSLPQFENSGFYLGLGKVGEYKSDTVRQYELITPPVVIDNSNTLNPLGVTRCVAEEKVYPVLVNPEEPVTKLSQNTSYVVVGQKAEQYANVGVEKHQYRVTVGNGHQTAPKTLSTRVIVKAVNPRPSAISSTHKQIIKAFTVKD